MRYLWMTLFVFVIGCGSSVQQVETAPPEPPAPTADPEAVIHMLAAKRAEREDNSFRAVIEWQAASAADPTSLDLRLGLAKALMENGQTSHALAQIQEIIAIDSLFVPARTYMASYSEQQHNYREAARHLEVVVRITGDERLGWRLAGMYNDEHRTSDVLRVLSVMVRHPDTVPSDISRWSRVANTLRMDSAVVHLYSLALERWPGDESTVLAFGEHLARNGRRTEMASLYQSSLAANPGMHRVAVQWSALLATQQRWAELDSVMSALPVETEEELGAVKGWIRTLLQRQQFPRAQREVEKLFPRYVSDGELQGFLGAAHLIQGNAQGALQAFNEAVRADSSLRSMMGLAQTQLAVGNVEEAERVSRRMVARYPGESAASHLLGRTLRAQGKHAESVEHFAAAARGNAANPQYSYDLGVSLEQTGQYEQAAEAFRYVLQIKPDDPVVLNYLGYMFADQNMNLNEALRFISRAVELQPDNGAYLDSMGWVLFRMGRYDESQRFLLNALRLEGPDPVILDHIGELYQALGRTEQAQGYWRQALTADPDNEQIRRKLEQIGGE